MSLFRAKKIIIKILMIKKLENMKKKLFFLNFVFLFLIFLLFIYFKSGLFVSFFLHKMTLQQLKVRKHCKLLGKYTFPNFF